MQRCCKPQRGTLLSINPRIRLGLRLRVALQAGPQADTQSDTQVDTRQYPTSSVGKDHIEA